MDATTVAYETTKGLDESGLEHLFDARSAGFPLCGANYRPPRGDVERRGLCRVCAEAASRVRRETSKTDAFAEFHARRNRERAARDAEAISWRKATLPGLPPAEANGYVARNGEARAYVRPNGQVYEFGQIAGRELRPRGEEATLYAAKSAAYRVVQQTMKEETVEAAAQVEKVDAENTAATVLRDALIAAIKEAVPDATCEWNKTSRYETFQIDGRSFGLVFAAGARTVSVKIPAHLRDIRLPANSGFAKSDYGLRRSVTKSAEVKTVAKAFAAAAKAART